VFKTQSVRVPLSKMDVIVTLLEFEATGSYVRVKLPEGARDCKRKRDDAVHHTLGIRQLLH
jgi:hypothetical protein